MAAPFPTYTLWCLLQGDLEPFSVSSPSNINIYNLKKLVLTEAFGHQPTVAARQLVLKQIKVPILSTPIQHARQVVESLGEDGFVELIEPRDILSNIYRDPPSEGLLHIYVQIRPIATLSGFPATSQKRAISDGDEHTAKKVRLSPLQSPLPSDDQHNALHALLMEANPDAIWYSTPSNMNHLPFPFIYRGQLPITRFHFSSSEPYLFEYMGRRQFSQLWQHVMSLNVGAGPSDLYVHGTMGYGKSHILVALACLLRRQGNRVVYLPDCRQMLINTVRYIQSALLCAFADSPTERDMIQSLSSYDEISHFCERLEAKTYFIIDQINALEEEEDRTTDNIRDSEKSRLSNLLRKLPFGHIGITSASANYRTTMYMAKKQTDDVKMRLMGGMSTDEMTEWWKHHKQHFTLFSTFDRQRVEDLTGCIPLLLRPFVNHTGKTLDDLEPAIWNDPVLASVVTNTRDFAVSQAARLSRQVFHNQYIPLMQACVLHRVVFDSGREMDHRYFYLDDSNHGCYTCGLARQGILDFLHQYGEQRIFLGPEWLGALEAFKHNPSVIGFTVEQILLGTITSVGISAGTFSIPGANITTFEDSITQLQTDKKAMYYLPLKFNQKAIDGIYVGLNRRAKTAHMVPMQITVAKRHKDSAQAFFANWANWTKDLWDFHIKVTFLWIHEGEQGRKEVEEKLRELRGTTKVQWPQHTVLWMSVDQVDKNLARTLARIRPQYGRADPAHLVGKSQQSSDVEEVGTSNQAVIVTQGCTQQSK